MVRLAHKDDAYASEFLAEGMSWPVVPGSPF